MKFYDREIGTETLRRIESPSHDYAQMTVITGRRRIGKTTLIKHAYEGKEMIYFFVAKNHGWAFGYAALSLDDISR